MAPVAASVCLWSRAGTFTLTVNGTVVCHGHRPSPITIRRGVCATVTNTAPDLSITSESFVNYETGDYSITFAAALRPITR